LGDAIINENPLLIFGAMFDLVESKFASDPGCSIRVVEFSNFYVFSSLACFCGVDLRFSFGVGVGSMRFVLLGNSWQMATFFSAGHE
jgi:hypothetical protein